MNQVGKLVSQDLFQKFHLYHNIPLKKILFQNPTFPILKTASILFPAAYQIKIQRTKELPKFEKKKKKF